MKEEKSVMEKMDLQYELLESGCCGMAGSFGYEKDKYEVSVACGERALLPAVRKAPLSTIIVADGFSCKEQIAQQSNRHGLHLAEVLKMAIDGRSDEMYPEDRFVKPRQAVQRQSMTRALALTSFAVAGALALWWLKKKR